MERKYLNLWRDIIPEGEYQISVQFQSNVFVIERDRHNVEHYNPRHLPAIPVRAYIFRDKVIINSATLMISGYFTRRYYKS